MACRTWRVGSLYWVNGMRIRTSEALYQACRFPHRPDVQRLIIEQLSPMTAKMKSKPYRHDSRRDWNRVRVNIMRWCLHVKLAQNWDVFSELLLNTDGRSIVEHSRKDDFWGAKPVDEHTLAGMNVLGCLLMELRDSVKTEPREKLVHVEPLHIADFLIGGRPIEPVTTRTRQQAEPVTGPPALSWKRQEQESARHELLLTRSPRTFGEDSTEHPADHGGGSLEPYPTYKDSGVTWLRKIPAHWRVERLKSLVDNVVEQGTSQDGVDAYVALEQVESWTGRIRTAELVASLDSQLKRFRSGDVLFGKLRPYLAKVYRTRFLGHTFALRGMA